MDIHISKPAYDFAVQNEGSVVLLHPVTNEARAWVEDHIGSDNGFQPYWLSVVIEHRYVSAILNVIAADGLDVSA